jgi:hypothetical protein
MTNNLLYYYIYEPGNAHIIGFCYKNNPFWSEGWSRILSDTKKIGWEWTQAKPYSGNTIGARCLIQW